METGECFSTHPLLSGISLENQIMANLNWPNDLLEWYSYNKRSMPWRDNPLPYYVWVSEVMLQQTQVDTVIPYFERFITKFPNLELLANADLQDVLKMWEGLGYYARARNFHKAVGIVIQELHGKIPDNFDDLRQLPGLGDYTAAAVASIAYGQKIPVVDGNVLRVFARFWGIKQDIKTNSVKTKIFNRLKTVIKPVESSDFNQSLMELGALICRPKHPLCPQCPIQNECIAFEKGITDKLPNVKRKAKVPTYQYGACVIWHGDKFLISKRENDVMLGGLWEFPGGRLDGKHNLQKQSYELVKSVTNFEFQILKNSYKIKHTYSHFKIELIAFKCELVDTESSPTRMIKHCNDLRWITFSEVINYPFDKATLKVIDQVARE